MRNVKLATPVKLPKGIITRIISDDHLYHVNSLDDLDDFASIMHDIDYSNRSYKKLSDIGGPDILLFRTYQKLQNAVWRLYDKYPVPVTEGADLNANDKRTVHRSRDLFGCEH